MNAVLQTIRNLGPIRVAVIAGVAVALLAFAIYMASRLGGGDYALLYGDLSTQDAGRVDQRLQQLAIPHQIGGDGTQILVPSELVGKARIQLASEGLPSGGSVGYEIFDKSQGLATSSFVQNVNQLRALEGELSRTISSIDGVRSARVHLVMPQRELFTRERQEPSASILLRMSGPRRLTREQAQAIQHLVATAVPQLKPERISLVDERGTLLAKGLGEGELGSSLIETAEEMRISYENRLSSQIEALLERTLGFNKVRAEVNAEIDHDRVAENREVFNPDEQVARSTQTVSDQAEQSESDTNPSVTIANNLPQGQAQNLAPSANSSRNKRTEETINYEISKVTRTQQREPGAIKRVSVAVLVDGTYTPPANGDGAPVYAPRSQKELEKIEALVKSAMGFDATRGDQVEVVNLPFVEPPADASDTPRLFGLERRDLTRLSELIVLGIIAILVLFLVVRPLIARLFEAMPQAAAAGAGAGGGLLTGPGISQRALAGPGGTPGTDLALAEEDDVVEDMIDLSRIEGRVKASSLRRIGEMVEKHPEDVVAIIRNWLYQES